MYTPLAAFLARDAIENPRRFVDDGVREEVVTRRPVRRRFAGALRWSADRLAPLTD